MNIKRIFKNLFLKTEFLSVQARLVLTILIILHLIFNDKVIEYLILVFFIPIVMSIVSPFIAILGYYLGFKNEYVENEMKFLEKNLINLLYKILLLIYILIYIRLELSYDIIAFSIIYISLYYLTRDMKYLYKTTKGQELIIIVLTVISTIYLEKVRLKNS